MKKLVLLFAAFVAVSFASCGNKAANNQTENAAVEECCGAKACADSVKACADSTKAWADSTKHCCADSVKACCDSTKVAE